MKTFTHSLLLITALLFAGTTAMHAKKTYHALREVFAVGRKDTVQVSVNTDSVNGSSKDSLFHVWVKTEKSADSAPKYTFTFTAKPRPRYTLIGWYTSQTGGTLKSSEAIFKETEVLGKEGETGNYEIYYARFGYYYHIAFNGGANTVGSMDNVTAIETVGKVLPPCGFKCWYTITYNLADNEYIEDGATSQIYVADFIGWHTSLNSDTAIYNDKDTVTLDPGKADSTVTLYAKWKADFELPQAYKDDGKFYATKWVNARNDSIGTPGKKISLYGSTTITPAGWKERGQMVVQTAPKAKIGLTYSGIAQNLVENGEIEGGAYVFSFDKQYSFDIPQATEVGTYKIYYRTQPDSLHYGSSAHKDSLYATIAPANLSVKAKNISITYGDTIPEYTCSVSGWVNGEDTLNLLQGTPTLHCNYKQGDKAGSYPITIDHNLSAPNYTIIYDEGTLEVKKATPKLTKPTAKKNLTYNGSSQTLVDTGKVENGKLWYALDNGSYTDKAPSATNAGTYTVKYKVIGIDENYEDIEEESFIVAIAPAELTITANDTTITYGDPIPTFTVFYQGLVNNEKPKDVLKGELVFACAYGEDNAAGTYPINPSGVSSGNYDITFQPGTLTVQKVAPTLIDAPAARTNLTYNGSAQELVEAGSATGGTIKFTMDTTDSESWKTYIPTATNAGKYTIYYKLFGDKNHFDMAIDSVKAEIDKAVAKLSSHPKAKTPTYTGKPQVLIEAGVADGGTILYRLKDGEFAQALPQGTLAGNYTVHYKVVGDENHYDFMPDPDSLVARVNKASLAIRGDNKAIKYGDPEPAEYTASCTGWVNGEDQSVLHGTLTVTCGYHQWNNAGSYAIVPGGVTADNYAITFKNGTLTVNKAPLTITADDQTVTYGDPAPEYTASYSGWKGQDGPSVLGSSLLFICAYGAGNDAGSYDIQPHGAEATNYNITYANGTLTVNKAIAVVTPPTAIEGLKFTGNPLILINAGHTTGGTLEYALDEQDYSPVLPTATAVGTYTVYYRVNGGTNYNDVGSDSLMVTIAEPDEPTALAPVQAPVNHVQKIIRHDQLIIIRDDNTYTIHGQRIDKPQRK